MSLDFMRNVAYLASISFPRLCSSLMDQGVLLCGDSVTNKKGLDC
jgi:hypothetical protein